MLSLRERSTLERANSSSEAIAKSSDSRTAKAKVCSCKGKIPEESLGPFCTDECTRRVFLRKSPKSELEEQLNIKEKRSIAPAARAAAREQAVKEGKAKKAAAESKKKAEKAKSAASAARGQAAKVSKQGAKGAQQKVQARTR